MEEVKASFELNVKELFVLKLDYKYTVLTSFYQPHRFMFTGSIHRSLLWDCSYTVMNFLLLPVFNVKRIFNGYLKDINASSDTNYTHLSPVNKAQWTLEWCRLLLPPPPMIWLDSTFHGIALEVKVTNLVFWTLL